MADVDPKFAGGLVNSMQRLLGSLLSVVQTRIEIVAMPERHSTGRVLRDAAGKGVGIEKHEFDGM